jgi:hypothetical protein
VTQTQAEAAALALKGAMTRWGVRCSVELQAGRGNDPWGVYTKYHRMWHHTVSTYKPGGNLTPVLSICKNGRSDVPGPLCNGYLGYDKVFRIICMGEANHPGRGGPITIDGVRIPEDSARKPTFGIEVEGGLQTWEDIDDLGPDMLQTMGRADNALAEWSSRPLTSQLEHKTWAPDRKVDRKDFDAARTRGIALTKKWFALGNDEENFMAALTEAEQRELYDWVRQMRVSTVPFAQDAQSPDERFQVQELLERAFTKPGSGTRLALVGTRPGETPSITGLIEFGLQRSPSFKELEAKVDHIIEMLHAEEPPPGG